LIVELVLLGRLLGVKVPILDSSGNVERQDRRLQQQDGTPSRRSPLFEIADVVVRLDYVAGGGVNSYLPNQWLRIVPVSLLLGLDSLLTPPPPMTLRQRRTKSHRHHVFLF